MTEDNLLGVLFAVLLFVVLLAAWNTDSKPSAHEYVVRWKTELSVWPWPCRQFAPSCRWHAPDQKEPVLYHYVTTLKAETKDHAQACILSIDQDAYVLSVERCT